MKKNDQLQAKAKRNLIKGMFALVPLVLLVVLTFIEAWLNGTGKVIEGSAWRFIKDAATQLLSPHKPGSSLLTFGNFLALLIVGPTLLGVAFISSAWHIYDRLRKAKWEADNDQLKNDFRE